MTDSHHYTPSHWSQASAVQHYRSEAVTAITVNDRAATRQAIIASLRKRGYSLVERSTWGAKPPHTPLVESNWDYRDIVVHHAGHSYICVVDTEGAVRQMKQAQEYDLKGMHDIGYHYAVSCPGQIFEARDIRYVGSHVKSNNTGKIAIVLLENLAEAGEAWTQEYRNQPIWGKIQNTLNIARDATAFDHEMPTKEQIEALGALVETLREFFKISHLGGHREYQVLAPGHEGRACPGKYGMQVVAQLRRHY
jgi:hypothetical protein